MKVGSHEVTARLVLPGAKVTMTGYTAQTKRPEVNGPDNSISRDTCLTDFGINVDELRGKAEITTSHS